MTFPTLRSARLDGRARALSWSAQLVAATIFAITLPFKLGGAPESVALFTQLGAEPYGRLALGLLEAVAVILLLLPSTAVLGGLLTMGLLAGAIFAHLTVLGVVFQGDASLFTMAVVGFVAGAVVVWMRRRSIPVIGIHFDHEMAEMGTDRVRG